MEARNDRTGEVIFKDNLESAVAGIVQVCVCMCVCMCVCVCILTYIHTSAKVGFHLPTAVGLQNDWK